MLIKLITIPASPTSGPKNRGSVRGQALLILPAAQLVQAALPEPEACSLSPFAPSRPDQLI